MLRQFSCLLLCKSLRKFDWIVNDIIRDILLPRYRLSCAPMPNKYGDRDFGGRERWLYFSARQKGRHSRLVPQELCPPPSFGNRRRFYTWGSQSGVYDKNQSSEGLAFFFFLHYFKIVTAGVRQPGNWVRLSLGIGLGPFFWNANATGGDLLQGSAGCNSHSFKE